MERNSKQLWKGLRMEGNSHRENGKLETALEGTTSGNSHTARMEMQMENSKQLARTWREGRADRWKLETALPGEWKQPPQKGRADGKLENEGKEVQTDGNSKQLRKGLRVQGNSHEKEGALETEEARSGKRSANGNSPRKTEGSQGEKLEITLRRSRARGNK
jgi:hypothetical protein